MHLVSLNDWSDDDILAILDAAKSPPKSGGKRVMSAFFEPSTRTRLSFEAAAQALGHSTLGFSDGTSTSVAKGESLEDTIQVLAGYADAIVLRHPETGAAARAAAVSDVPIVNAGDGTGEHPTQTLLDLFTIRQELGRLDVKLAVAGDLEHGRTVHSLIPAIQRFGGEVVQVPVNGSSVDGIPEVSMEEALQHDVFYATRVQNERGGKGSYVVEPRLAKAGGAILMHPLPRRGELPPELDALPTAKYFAQARNGVPVRMAVLNRLLENP